MCGDVRLAFLIAILLCAKALHCVSGAGPFFVSQILAASSFCFKIAPMLTMVKIEEKPPWVKPRIVAAPKIKQIYWCDYWTDAHLPEMWKTRPIIVISHKNTLHGVSLVLPLSTEPANEKNPWAVKLNFVIQDDQSYVICNQPSSVAASRLSQFKGKIPVLPQDEFDQVLDLFTEWIPKPRV